MASSGIGNKFVSVNLNKSYGQPGSSSNGVSNSGRIGSGRASSSSGHGGMVVLSRPRAQISGSKGTRLSVPPPLNLPSLRREHEGLEPSGVGSNGASGVGSGSGFGSGIVGWTKPQQPINSLSEKDSGVDNPIGKSPIGSSELMSSSAKAHGHGVDVTGSEGNGRGGSLYMPPGARASSPAMASQSYAPVEKAVVLRGEDFPSLQAVIMNPPPPAPKQRETLQKQSKKQEEDGMREQKAKLQEMSQSSAFGSDTEVPLAMRPQMMPRAPQSGSSEKQRLGSLGVSEKSQKQEGLFSVQLPNIRMTHLSDWADDERDTGHRFSRTEVQSIRSVDYDIPRSGLPRTSNGAYDLHQSRKNNGSFHGLAPDCELRDTIRDADSAKLLQRGDLYGRESISREGRDSNTWRSPVVQRDTRDGGIHRIGVGSSRPTGLSRDTGNESKFDRSTYTRNSSASPATEGAWGGQDSRYRESYNRDGVYGWVNQVRSHVSDISSTRVNDQNVRGRNGDSVTNSMIARSSFSSVSKGFGMSDPIMNFGKQKRLFSNNGKPYTEDAFVKDFGSPDPFLGSALADMKLFRRKKDATKQVDFHDPVRESFEAELERVQKMQEQERQRAIEEQARALDLARKEEEERERVAREEEERQRRIEEEAREAAWRAEQERLEAASRLEEQKKAREEEKRNMLLEEDRRKEGARQKLLDLEARIAARRQAEAAKDDKLPKVGNEILPPGKDRDASRLADSGDWEDSERTVEQIASSASSESLGGQNGSYETGFRHYMSRDGNSFASDRVKHVNSWKRDLFENGNGSGLLPHDHDNEYHSPSRDAFAGGRGFPRRELHGSLGAMPTRGFGKMGMLESHLSDDVPYTRGQRWNFQGENERYSRSLDAELEYVENPGDKFGDIGWGTGRSQGAPHGPYGERSPQSSEIDSYSFGRSRHSMRQPRVLPPPSLALAHKGFSKSGLEKPGSSLVDQRALQRGEQAMQMGSQSGIGDKHEQSDMVAGPHDAVIQRDQDDKSALRCDSQSSLSVSSPPNSPTHLSHDDLEEVGDSPASPSGSEQIVLPNSKNGFMDSEENKAIMTSSASGLVTPLEDEEWVIENEDGLQEQEEYDEEEDAYQEEDEVPEGDEENLVIAEDFDDLHMVEEHKMTDKVDGATDLAFDEGLKVEVPHAEDSDRGSGSSDKVIEAQSVSVAIEEELKSCNDQQNAVGPGAQTDKYSSEVPVESTSETVQMVEKGLQDLVLHPSNSAQVSVLSGNRFPDGGDASTSDITMVTQPPIPSILHSLSPTPVAQPIMSSVSSVATVRNQSEVPVKLQFGLFSTPSLIPSPVPAIQIGSIQMPLHLGQPITQIHPSQPPMFQFGQLRYPSPLSQGILPLAPQAVSYVHPTVPAHYSLNQQSSVSQHDQVAQAFSFQTVDGNENISSSQPANQSFLLPNPSMELNALQVNERPMSEAALHQSQAENSIFSSSSVIHDANVKRVYRPVGINRESLYQSPDQGPNERGIIGSQTVGTVPSMRGKRGIHSAKNVGSGYSIPPLSELARFDPSKFPRRGRRNIRRTEFRVRERQPEDMGSSNYNGHVEKLDLSSRVGGDGAKSVRNKSSKSIVESESFMNSNSHLRGIISETKMDRTLDREAPLKRQLDSSHSTAEKPKRNGSSEEDVDAPLQSGVVRVFKQSGIETPSDEDDFIEVRSKRQMLNVRREQREKENKAKSRVLKAARKPRSVLTGTAQSGVVSSNSPRMVRPFGGDSRSSGATGGICSETAISEGRESGGVEVPTTVATPPLSQPLPPIGTPPAAFADSQAANVKSLPTSSFPAISIGAVNIASGFSFENKNVAIDVPSSLGSWGGTRNQQVMSLTQTQLKEALKPVRFDVRATLAPLGDRSALALEPSKPSSSVLTQDKPFISSASPLNSLLAGEKIQFGAVTSPTVLPPGSCSVSKGISPSVSCRSNVAMDQGLSAPENDCTMFFEKGERTDEPCVQLEDPESEAEAAASAVAVAAISNDEVVGNGLGSGSVTVADAKSFGVSDVLPSGGTANGHALATQTRSEESLTVALPADLSVETPLSLWPPLQSPQSSSSAMLSHFPGAPPPSHYPCFKMNPMMGGPIFAFGPHDESSGAQQQAQKNGSSSASPLGGWQQCHSGVDSFYGPSAGFAGPFIGPSSAIPGVQAPPHMVVYNHFAPVGPFGQVGLSFMGTTYIPSGKQPDWKHTPVSSPTVGLNEGDMNNMVLGQRNPSMPAAIQHLAPGSPLVPIASPMGLFDISPFQSSTDLPIQARWSHIPAASPIHSLPPLSVGSSVPPQQQFNHPSTMDHSNNSARFHETRTSKTQDAMPFSASDTTPHFPEELGLGDSVRVPNTTTPTNTGRPNAYNTIGGKPQNSKNSPRVNANTSEASGTSMSITTSSNSCSSGSSQQAIHGNHGGSGQVFKPQTSQQGQGYLHPIGYSEQRGGGPGQQKVGSTNEWQQQRRGGFQGRSQGEKSYAPSKMKQIYVAKPTTAGNATAI
ncbi:uncharacterized protein LOC18423745 isoform X2 [Amborella trichopoda]|uniref:Uncharacterized protein n=1 Tax=Amborella trichopoda TaxID=13333 RepID=W1NJW8_AMBTC|nr:uncharacterized protein LOC18423745 isoform X2 [Amborella trichopoda]ERM95808.1 hypothetical protein AMTR_s00060p00030440 [Amborella trichopoda]|eukprot:XP_006828392.1 uncharacterized protein LOC18423745 isoform X2 [Amborella trichopoda]